MRQLEWPFAITSATDGDNGHPAPNPTDENSTNTNPATEPLPTTGGGAGLAILGVMLALITRRRQRWHENP